MIGWAYEGGRALAQGREGGVSHTLLDSLTLLLRACFCFVHIGTKYHQFHSFSLGRWMIQSTFDDV